MTTNDAQKKLLLHSGVAGALVGLGLIPTAAKAADSTLDVAKALDAPPAPPSNPDQPAQANVSVKTREVGWEVPWIEDSATSAVGVAPTTAQPQLAVAFATDAAVTEAAKNEFPLIAVTAPAIEPAAVPSVDTIYDIEEDGLASSDEGEVFDFKVIEADVPAEETTVEVEVSEFEPVEAPQTLYQNTVPLLALQEDDEEEEGESFEATTPLLTLAIEEEDDEEEEEDALLLAAADVEDAVETVSPYLAFALTEEEQAAQEKAPWLASSMTLLNSDSTEDVDTPLVALNASDDDEAEKVTPWLAIAAEEQEDADDDRLSIALPEQTEEQQDPRLSIVIPGQNEAKRPANWVTAIPEELSAPESTIPEVAAISPSTANQPATYDVTNLQDIAITPTNLANANEESISVNSSDVEFLSPEPNALLDIPATSVVLRFPVGANIALLSNGQLVDSTLVGRTETDSETQLRTQSWYGIVLNAGDNLLEVISTDTGEVLQQLPLTVKGLPERLVLLNPGSIPADGRSTQNIRGHFLDETGNIAFWESEATLRTSDGQFIGADLDPDRPGFQVEVRQGEFVAELQSSLESHLVQIQANASGYEAFSQIQFVTPQRPHLVSGVVDLRFGARGTDFYDSYREFLPVDGDNDYEFDADVAAFATGNIGDWLYTGAYNSDRSLNENCQGDTTLFRTSSADCGNSYATYGDDSSSEVVAPSLDSVYLRVERTSPSSVGTDYAMWGDFNTQEFATPAQIFTSTSRQLHGFKTNYNFGRLAATGLYANHVEGFQRDVIAPDGTSGFYFTSQRDIVPGSENVFLELEELERPGTVLDRQQLSRGADYTIDYDRGTFLFNDPIMRTSVNEFGELLVRRIVTTYQHENGEDTNILAGRLQYNLGDKRTQDAWLGSSYFVENQGSRDFTLYGADARIALGTNAQITAEVARSSSSFDTSDDVSGNAYRVELEGETGGLSGRAYFRSTDAGFSNAATTSFVAGQTRYGADLTASLGRTTSLRARYDHEDNFGSAPRVLTDLSDLLSGLNATGGTPLDNSLTTYALGITQQIGGSTAEVDWIHRDRTDRATNLGNVTSDQLRSRLTTPLARNLTIVAQNELNLSSNVDPIYPSRTLIGLNWEAMPGVNVGLNQIFYAGGGNDRGSSTSLDVTGEHTFASDTTVRGRFSSIDGAQLGGSIGLEQGIRLAPGLNLDLGYEKVFSTFGNETAASTQFSQPVATANTASALALSGGESYSIGLSYTDNPDFQASTRFEHRSSSRGSNTVFDISALGRLTPELTVLGDYRMAHAANQGLRGLGTTSLLKLGLAYRNPEDDRFNALLRYEHRMNPNTIPSNATAASSTETQEHLFSAEAIYAPNWRWELYGKYALRNSRTDISAAGNSFSGNTTVQLAQARATYRLGYRWDVVGEARWLGGSGYNETGFSVEAGYYPLPDLRLSAGYSGGATDYDFGENRNAGGFYVGATAKLSGLLNGFGTRPATPAQQQESVVQVSNETVAPQQYPEAAEL